MARTRDFKETVAARLQDDPAFAQALLEESVTLFVHGEPKSAKRILRDLVNATVGFPALAEEISKPAKRLHRMLSRSGNPTVRKYLCMHDGRLLDLVDLSANLRVKPNAQNFIKLLETTHLIYRLPPFGYGKDVLRARFKVYSADAAIASAVILKGKASLEDPAALGVATVTAVFKHLFARCCAQNARSTCGRGRKGRAVDRVAEVGGQILPLEVKYRAQHTRQRKPKFDTPFW